MDLNSSEVVLKIASILIMMITSYEDFKEKKIHILFPVILGGVSLIYQVMLFMQGRFDCSEVLLSILPGAAMLLIALFGGRQLGFGDGFVVMALGPLLGFAGTSSVIFIAFLFSAIVSALLLAFGKVNGKSTFAFVPFLTLGAGVTILAMH